MTQNKQHHYTVDSANWKGYTLEEIRYARAYTAARLEINRERLLSRMQTVQKEGLLPSGHSSGLIGKVLGAFSYLDMAVIAWKLGSRIFKLTRSLRRS